MRVWIKVCIAALAMLWYSAHAQATVITPGGPSAVPPPSPEVGTLVVSEVVPYSFGGGADTGTIRSEVVTNAVTGQLDFLYQATVTKGDLATLAAQSFTGFSTDVYQDTGPEVGVTGGDVTVLGGYPSATASRTSSGSVVNFQFVAAIPGGLGLPITSNVLLFRTNART